MARIAKWSTKSGECINREELWSVDSSGNLLTLDQLSMIGRLSEKSKIDATNGKNALRMGFWFGMMNLACLGTETAGELRLKAASTAKSTEMASV